MSNTKPKIIRAEIRCAHTEIRPVESLIENPRNPNHHPESQLKLLAKIITATGWRSPIVVSNRSGFVVKGHGRLQAAKLAGLTEAPVDLQDYESEAAEWADMIADNRLAELAEISLPELKDLLQELDTGALDMDLTGFDQDALAGLMLQENQDEGDAEPQIDKASELAEKWGVKRGQVWALGEHRLACGDSTSADDVARLLADVKPHLMVTDPPYGVEYDASWRETAGLSGPGTAKGKVLNDDIADWREAWALFPGDVAYVWHAGIHAATVSDSLVATDFAIRSQIIWAKSALVMSRCDYHWQHEPCWYAVRKGKVGHYDGGRKQSTLWQIDKPKKSETGHSTQKPLECMARPIRNNSQVNDLIYEPFSGSGTTIIACEQLGRKCRALEISPGYVAVALQRWADATGKTPTLING